jgi:hypothetical protein
MKLFIGLTVIIGCTFAIIITLLKIAPKPIQCPVHTQYDVILECQKLSASTTHKEWGYKSCIEELGKTINTGTILTL